MAIFPGRGGMVGKKITLKFPWCKKDVCFLWVGSAKKGWRFRSSCAWWKDTAEFSYFQGMKPLVFAKTTTGPNIYPLTESWHSTLPDTNSQKKTPEDAWFPNFDSVGFCREHVPPVSTNHKKQVDVFNSSLDKHLSRVIHCWWRISGSPPGMALKPCKLWEQLSNLNWWARFQNHQQYS